jgi:ATP-dependent Clp protease protease subunit
VNDNYRAQNYLVPTVVESSNRGERAYDLYSRLLARAHHLSWNPDRRHDRQPGLRADAVSRVRRPREGHQPLHQLTGWRHHWSVRHLRHDEVHQARRVDVLLRPGRLGRRGSAGAGSKGKRYALPHSRVLLHQPWGGVGGQASDIEIQAREILRMKDMLNAMLAATPVSLRSGSTKTPTATSS